MKRLFFILLLMSCGSESSIPLDGGIDGAAHYIIPDEIDENYNHCCKVCVRGLACGDTCINAYYDCYTNEGCACNVE